MEVHLVQSYHFARFHGLINSLQITSYRTQQRDTVCNQVELELQIIFWLFNFIYEIGYILYFSTRYSLRLEMRKCTVQKSLNYECYLSDRLLVG